jgi:hypothetical protein
MASINPDVMLLVTEEMSLEDIRSLMLTSKSNNALIKTYEQSIAKARICRMIHDRELRPLSSPVLSLKSKDRRILGPTNFDVVEELELRASLIEKLFDPKNETSRRFVKYIYRRPHLVDLSPHQVDRLELRLRDTCTVLDRIADCAATIRREFELEPKLPFPDFGEEHLERVIHRARQNLIAALGPLDVAFVYLLSSLTLFSYAWRVFGPGTSLMAHANHLGAFQEVVVQHGTMAVFHSAFPGDNSDFFESLISEEKSKEDRWAAGERSVAPDWSPSGVLRSLVKLGRAQWSNKKKVRDMIPKEHLDELRKAKRDGLMKDQRLWLIRRWLDTNDEALAHRPPIPQQSWADLFAWAATQDPSRG